MEDHATDRAFRIGHGKNARMHKFITKSAMEEKIDAMLAGKAEIGGRWTHPAARDMIPTLFALVVTTKTNMDRMGYRGK